jgi:hypothetical protein
MTVITKADDETAVFDIDATTEVLFVIADWKDDLRSRIRRALLRFELVGLNEAEQDQLAAEVEEFKRVCRALIWPAAVQEDKAA